MVDENLQLNNKLTKLMTITVKRKECYVPGRRMGMGDPLVSRKFHERKLVTFCWTRGDERKVLKKKKTCYKHFTSVTVTSLVLYTAAKFIELLIRKIMKSFGKTRSRSSKINRKKRSSVCQHGRRRSRCKPCGGSGICHHCRDRTKCRPCGGSQICRHGRERTICKPCGGGSICRHDRRRSRCRLCGGGSFCHHDRIRSRCRLCGGGSICRHGRSVCKNCHPNRFTAFVVRAVVRRALKQQSAKKSTQSLKLLGCSLEQLRSRLEVQFKRGMKWSNYGRKGWHIDHRRPCSSFDLQKPLQQRSCFHYTNLVPLWAIDNLVKGSKYDPSTFTHRWKGANVGWVPKRL